jgi:hypothetical protein
VDKQTFHITSYKLNSGVSATVLLRNRVRIIFCGIFAAVNIFILYDEKVSFINSSCLSVRMQRKDTAAAKHISNDW